MKARGVKMCARADTHTGLTDGWSVTIVCDSGEANPSDSHWLSVSFVCTVAGRGASLFAHPGVVPTLLPAGMGDGDRRRDQPETRVRTSVQVVCRVILNYRTSQTEAEVDGNLCVMDISEPRTKLTVLRLREQNLNWDSGWFFTKQVFLPVGNLFSGTESSTSIDCDQTENEIKWGIWNELFECQI